MIDSIGSLYYDGDSGNIGERSHIVNHCRYVSSIVYGGIEPACGNRRESDGALPARGGEVLFTEHVISTAADAARSVFATDVDGGGDTDVVSAS